VHDRRQLRERRGQLPAARRAQRGDAAHQPILRHVGRFARDPLPFRGQRQHHAAAVVFGDDTFHETARGEARHHHRHRALMGMRQGRKLVHRDRRTVGQRLQHEQLRAGQPDLALGAARRFPQSVHDAADGIEHRSDLALVRCIGSHTLTLPQPAAAAAIPGGVERSLQAGTNARPAIAPIAVADIEQPARAPVAGRTARAVSYW
jgi:hypothetical protein